MAARRFLIWFWAGGGGGSQFALRLARRLNVRFGSDAATLSLRADDPALAQARAMGLSALGANVVSDRRRRLATLTGLSESAGVLAMHARDADAVIVPMNFAAAAPLAMTLAKPLIYCAHDPAPHPGDYEALGQRLTQAALLGRASRVVALSQDAGKALRTVRSKLRVAPLGAVFEPAPAPPRTQGGPVRLLMIGRMIRYKGLDILADAIARLAHRDDWRLRVLGDGPALDDSMLARFGAPQVEEARRVWLSEAEIDAEIAACDVLLAPYRSATQSGIVAQAQAFGRPCLATPVGALAEQIGAGGWVAARADAEAFATALEAVLDAPAERESRMRQAVENAEAQWESDAWNWLFSERL